MSETMSPRAFMGTAQQLIDDAIELRAENAYFRRALTHADEVVKAERENSIIMTNQLECLGTDNTRLSAQIAAFRCDNAKLEASVKELQEALAEATLHNASLERLAAEARIDGLTRKLIDRDRQLAASRGRAAELQRRINIAAGQIDQARLMLVDTISE
jgi:small-conductance mechanosensitive channel